MEKFSLSLIDIAINYPFRQQKYTQLKHMQETMKKKEIQQSLIKFLYNFFIEFVSHGNNTRYINHDVIYWDKDNNTFRYSKLNHVYFDSKNIVFLHPMYIKDEERVKKRSLKFILWSIGILILKYINHYSLEDILRLHNNYSELIEILHTLKLKDQLKKLIHICLTYEDDKKFTELYIVTVYDSYINIDENSFCGMTKTNGNCFKEDDGEKRIKIVESENDQSIKEQTENPFPYFRQCPTCHFFVENTGFFKFTTCYSPICKGNKYFCWICNHKLYINDKENHFSDYGIYSDYCANINYRFTYS